MGDELKENAKKIAKKAGKIILKTLLKVLIVPIMIVILLCSIWYAIEEEIIKLLAAESESVVSKTQIEDDGNIKIDDEKIKLLEQALQAQKINTKAVYLSSDFPYLRKFLETDLVTSSPDTGGDELTGIIKIKRGTKELEYISINKLEELINKQDTKALDYFSIKRDSDGNILKEIIVARKTITTVERISNQGTDSSTTTMTLKGETIDFQSVADRYSMPFEFLVALCRISQNPEWVIAITQLIKEDSYIDLTIYESVDETEREETVETMTDVKATIDGRVSMQTVTNKETNKVKTQIYSLVPFVTYADTWYLKETQEVVAKEELSYPYGEGGQTKQEGDRENPLEPPIPPEEQTGGRTIYRKSTIKESRKLAKHSLGKRTSVSNEDKFLGLWKNELGRYNKNLIGKEEILFDPNGELVRYEIPPASGIDKPILEREAGEVSNAHPNTILKESPVDKITKNAREALLQILSVSERTQSHEIIMRYLIKRYTDPNYKQENFDEVLGSLDEITFGDSLDNITESGGNDWNGGSGWLGDGSDISLITPSISKENFKKALQAYYDRTKNESFKNNFLNRADLIYDWGIKYNVNPELVITFALKESGFDVSGDNQNFWGLKTPNGSPLYYYSSFEEGVRDLSDAYSRYMPGGKFADDIQQKYNERSVANCNPNGYGPTGTLKGAISMYSDLIGDYNGKKHTEGNWGDGGNIYLKIIYGDQFDEKCGNIHKIDVDLYTIQEKADYTAYLYENQLKYWNNIFGEYVDLNTGGNGNTGDGSGNTQPGVDQPGTDQTGFLGAAHKIWQIVSNPNDRENYVQYSKAFNKTVPVTGRYLDCSSFVSWVIYEYGYTEFKGPQNSSSGFIATNWNSRYGWTEIPVDYSENPIDKLQPGDILVRTGHVSIISHKSNGRIYSYDAGSGEANWKQSGGKPIDATWFLTWKGSGKIIRVTPPK